MAPFLYMDTIFIDSVFYEFGRYGCDSPPDATCI